MSKLDETYSALCREEETLTGRLEVIRLQKTVLEQAGANLPTLAAQMPVKLNGRPDKAPAGALAEAIVKILKESPGLGRADIIAQLKAKNYPHSMDPLHISKTLQKLAKGKDKRLKGKGPRSVRRYWVSQN